MKGTLIFLTEDARLLDRIRQGDEGALVSLHQGSRRAVASFIERNSGSSDDADDMLQEALIILWERVRAGKFEQTAKLSTFLFATVRNLWLRQLARKRREPFMRGDGTGEASEDPSALDSMMEEEETLFVRDAVARLGEPCRSLLVLYYWEEASMEQIAATLGFANAATVKARKYQCKKQLEGILADTRVRS